MKREVVSTVPHLEKKHFKTFLYARYATNKLFQTPERRSSSNFGETKECFGELYNVYEYKNETYDLWHRLCRYSIHMRWQEQQPLLCLKEI